MSLRKETIREQIAVLRTENNSQTEKIDRLINIMDRHEKTSNKYRELTTVNSKEISWLKQWHWIVITGIVVAITSGVGAIVLAVINNIK